MKLTVRAEWSKQVFSEGEIGYVYVQQESSGRSRIILSKHSSVERARAVVLRASDEHGITLVDILVEQASYYQLLELSGGFEEVPKALFQAVLRKLSDAEETANGR